MITFIRVWAIIQRHLYPIVRDPGRILDTCYWPLIDLLLFGFMATWAQKSMTNGSSFQLSVLTCVALWYLVSRASLEIAKSLLIEIWDNHLANLFATPISLYELLLAWMSLGVMQSAITFLYSLTIIWFLYGQNIFVYIPVLLPCMLLGLFSGWIIGLFIATMLLSFGKSLEMLTWMTPWLFATLSGAFYPVELLPAAVQKISFMLPATYLFESARTIIATGTVPYAVLAKGFLLALVYCFGMIAVLKRAFEKSKKLGLARLE
jgi:ABC-2 type transport system permease protein